MEGTRSQPVCLRKQRASYSQINLTRCKHEIYARYHAVTPLPTHPPMRQSGRGGTQSRTQFGTGTLIQFENPIWDRHFDPIWDRSNLGQALWTSEHNHTRSRRELFQSVGRPRSPRHAQHRRSNLGQAPFVNRGHESRTSTDCGGWSFVGFGAFSVC